MAVGNAAHDREAESEPVGLDALERVHEARLLSFGELSPVVGHRQHPLPAAAPLGRSLGPDRRERHDDAARGASVLVRLLVHSLGRVLHEVENEKLKLESVAEHRCGLVGHLHEDGHRGELAELEGTNASVDGTLEVRRDVVGRAVLHVASHAVDDPRNLERLGVDPLDGRPRIGILRDGVL